MTYQAEDSTAAFGVPVLPASRDRPLPRAAATTRFESIVGDALERKALGAV